MGRLRCRPRSPRAGRKAEPRRARGVTARRTRSRRRGGVVRGSSSAPSASGKPRSGRRRGRRGDDALEVVQQEQELAIAETSCERVGRRLAGLLAEAECPDDDGRHGERVVDRGEPRRRTRRLRYDGATVRATSTARRVLPILPARSASAPESSGEPRRCARSLRDGRRWVCAESGGSRAAAPPVAGSRSGGRARRAGTAAPAGDALQAVVAEVAHLDALAGEVLVAWESTTWPPCAAAQMRAPRVRSTPT